MAYYIKYVNGEKQGEIESFLTAKQNKKMYEVREPEKSFYFEPVIQAEISYQPFDE